MTTRRLLTALVLVAGGWWLLSFVNSLRHGGMVSALVALTIGGCVSLLWWILQDHAVGLEPTRWREEDHRESVSPAQWDYRMIRLRRDLRDTLERSDRPDAIQPVLRSLAMERLRSKHGVDLAAEPHRARALLTPQVHDYLTTSPTSARRDPATVRAVLDRIEAL